MVDTGIFATTAEIGYKAGANASATSKAEAYTNSYIAQAESYINVQTMYNWSDNYGTLNADVKGVLKDAGSSLAAISVINYDMSGFSSRAEALNMINVLWARVQDCINALKDINKADFIRAA
jgi:hypothetical protein